MRSTKRKTPRRYPVEFGTLHAVKRRHVLRVLAACEEDRIVADHILGLDRKSLYRKLRRWALPDSDLAS